MASNKDEINLNRHPAKTYVTQRFTAPSGPERRASKVIDSTVGYRFDNDSGKTVLRETEGGRQVVEARFCETDREIKVITIQKYTSGSGRSHPSASLSFWGNQIPRLLEFLINIKRMHFPSADKIKISDDELRQVLLTTDQLDRLAVEDQDSLITLARGKITKRDVIALTYRREQLREFKRLLEDDSYFDAAAAKTSKEGVWQAFLERTIGSLATGLRTYRWLHLKDVGCSKSCRVQAFRQRARDRMP